MNVIPQEIQLLELSEFDAHVGEVFVFGIEGVAEKAEAILIKAVHNGSGKDPNIQREPFTLDFRFPPGANLGQGVFEVETAAGKKFPPIFLVPYAEDQDGWYMTSNFG